MKPFVLKRALGIAVLCVSSRGPLDRLFDRLRLVSKHA
jgi:hypothetical protein